MNRPSETPEGSNSYQALSLNLLDPCPPLPAVDEADNRSVAERIKQALSVFELHASLGRIQCGPLVTRFEIRPDRGTTFSAIFQRIDDIALMLEGRKVRGVGPTASEFSVFLEVAHPQPRSICLREVIDTDVWKYHRGHLPFALGLSVLGAPAIADLAEQRHLIAGVSVEGTAHVLHSLILSLLLGPSQPRVLLIDSSSATLSCYRGIPLLYNPCCPDEAGTVCEPKQSLASLKALLQNPRQCDGAPLVIVISDLAELVALAGKEIGEILFELAKEGANPEIHFAVGSSRPEIPALVKAVIPSRIALHMGRIDSIGFVGLHEPAGTESLFERSDMLFVTPKQDIARIHPPSIAPQEIKRITDRLRYRERHE